MAQSLMNAMNKQVQDIIAQLNKASQDATSSGFEDGIIQRIKTTIGSLTANIIDQTFSVGAMKNIVGQIAPDMAQSFAQNYRDYYLQASRLMARQAKNPATNGEWMKYLDLDSGFAAGQRAMMQHFGLSEAQMRLMQESVVRSQPNQIRIDYARNAVRYSGGAMKKVGVIPQYMTYQERLPAFYQGLSNQPQTTTLSPDERQALQAEVSDEQWKTIRSIAASNPSFEKALIMAGLAQRTVHNKAAG